MARKKKMSLTRSLMLADTAPVEQSTSPYDPDTEAPAEGIMLGKSTYFDAGVTRKPNTIMCLECDTTYMKTRYTCNMFGEQYDYGNRLYLKKTASSFVGYDSKLHNLIGYQTGENKIIADVLRGQWMINGVLQKFSVDKIEYIGRYNVYVGAMKDMAGAAAGMCEGMIIHRFRMWEDGRMVLCLVPARDADGKACLQDTVSGGYIYHSGSGSVTFV